MEYPKAIFKKYCRDNGMRYTPERDAIVDVIFREQDQFDIDELFLHVRGRYPTLKLAKASIYRMLPYLIRTGLIKEIGFKKRSILYEYGLRNPYRLRLKCLKCEKIFDYIDDVPRKKLHGLYKDRGFKMIWGIQIFGGYCKRCLVEERRKCKEKGRRV